MGFLFPIGLIFLLLAGPIILFYLLKLRREEMTVSSNLLWRKVLEDRQANAPWQKLRMNWLLILQLLLLLLLALILSQPFFETNAEAAGNIIVLLDSSATMQANDVTPSRFAKAKDDVNKLIDEMGSGDRMTLVLMHSYPEVIASTTGSKAELKSALDKARVTNEAINAKGAITLAATNADRNPGTTIVVVSNGGFARAEGLPPLRARVKYVKVGVNDDNQAITALRLRETGVSPQLFIGMDNFGDKPSNNTLQITVDGKVFNTREIAINANDKLDLTLTDLPPNAKIINANLKPAADTKDYLDIDNQAWTVRNAGDPQKVLLITTGNGFLETLLGRLPNYKVSKVAPADYELLKNRSDFDTFIFDEYTPANLPETGGIWFIDPGNNPIVPVTGKVDRPTVGRLEQNDPLLRYTDLTSIDIAEAKQFDVPGWARVVAASDSGNPLLVAGEFQGQRIVAMGFNLHNSNLALNVSWPILLVNTIGWLQPAGAVDSVTEVNPGEPVSFVVGSSTEQISVTPPGSGAQILKPTGNSASFTDTYVTGVYQVARRLDAGTSTTPAAGQASRNRVVNESFVVNLYSRIASNIKPLDDLGISGSSNTASNKAGATVKTARELWQPIALVAFILLMLEWFFFYRGLKFPFFGKFSKPKKTRAANTSS